jgi:hypothetical protein
MNRSRSNSFWRNPALAVAMAMLLAVSGVLAYTGLHAGFHHVQAGDAAHHDDSSSCAICLFHGSSSNVDFPPAPVIRPALVELVSITEPATAVYAAVIDKLWSGRAPPSLSVS